jgi:hypothetical protein
MKVWSVVGLLSLALIAIKSFSHAVRADEQCLD